MGDLPSKKTDDSRRFPFCREGVINIQCSRFDTEKMDYHKPRRLVGQRGNFLVSNLPYKLRANRPEQLSPLIALGKMDFFAKEASRKSILKEQNSKENAISANVCGTDWKKCQITFARGILSCT